MSTYFIISFLVLAFFLFFPASKLIWTLSVRRLQKKSNTALTEQEINGQKQRARIIALFVVLIFSYLFNLGLGINPGV